MQANQTVGLTHALSALQSNSGPNASLPTYVFPDLFQHFCMNIHKSALCAYQADLAYLLYPARLLVKQLLQKQCQSTS